MAVWLFKSLAPLSSEIGGWVACDGLSPPSSARALLGA